jgi:hypothetical protein
MTAEAERAGTAAQKTIADANAQAAEAEARANAAESASAASLQRESLSERSAKADAEKANALVHALTAKTMNLQRQAVGASENLEEAKRHLVLYAEAVRDAGENEERLLAENKQLQSRVKNHRLHDSKMEKHSADLQIAVQAMLSEKDAADAESRSDKAALATCNARVQTFEAAAEKEAVRKKEKDAKAFQESYESPEAYEESRGNNFGAKVRARRVRLAERVFV